MQEPDKGETSDENTPGGGVEEYAARLTKKERYRAGKTHGIGNQDFFCG